MIIYFTTVHGRRDIRILVKEARPCAADFNGMSGSWCLTGCQRNGTATVMF